MLLQYITRKQWILFSIGLVGFLLSCIITWNHLGTIVPLMALAFLVSGFVIILLASIQRTNAELRGIINTVNKATSAEIDRKEKEAMAHFEAVVSIYSVIRPELPLPPMRGWAASADLLAALVSEVHMRRPQLVVEASSGVSTLILAYCLKKIGIGRVVALEHDEGYANATRAKIVAHGLQDHAIVLHAPLVSHRLEGREYQWYDWESAGLTGTIDMLVIDGPPQATGPMARYPAVPLLEPLFGPKACVILDDGDRIDESRAAQLWSMMAGAVKLEHMPLTRGAWMLEFRKA